MTQATPRLNRNLIKHSVDAGMLVMGHTDDAATSMYADAKLGMADSLTLQMPSPSPPRLPKSIKDFYAAPTFEPSLNDSFNLHVEASDVNLPQVDADLSFRFDELDEAMRQVQELSLGGAEDVKNDVDVPQFSRGDDQAGNQSMMIMQGEEFDVSVVIDAMPSMSSISHISDHRDPSLVGKDQLFQEGHGCGQQEAHADGFSVGDISEIKSGLDRKYDAMTAGFNDDSVCIDENGAEQANGESATNLDERYGLLFEI